MQIPDIHDFRGRRIHMVGIGGSSMSGLAEMLIDKGYRVTGSDRTDGYLMDDVRRAGAEVTIGHRAENVHGADLVVFTAAISPDNPELQEARRLGIPTLERAYLLGQLMRGYPWAVAVCGAHGKTTTTSMLSQVLVENGMDPNVHIGGKLDAIGGSTRLGGKEIFLAEACEFRRSFLQISPTLAVVMNIDADHLDCYRDIDEIEETFGQFLSGLPENGLALGKGTDPRVVRQLSRLSCRTLTFGLDDGCDYHPGNYRENREGCASFDLLFGQEKLGEVALQVPGEFNVENALAALGAAHQMHADMDRACASLSAFRGAHRRFELTDSFDGIEIFHDYGHNPTEMRNAVHIARKRSRGRVIAVMQPHTFSRVRSLFADYLTCTAEADVTLVTDIFAAREKDPGDLNAGMIVDGMRANGLEACWTPTFDDTEAWLRANLRSGDLVITMGCGDINRLNEQIHRHRAEEQAT